MQPDITYQATEDGKLAVLSTTTETTTYSLDELRAQLAAAESNRSAQAEQHKIDDTAWAAEIARIEALMAKATELGISSE